MKSLITFALVLMGLTLHAQSVFDFSVNPLTSGWTYYDNYGSNPNPGFKYDSINQHIEYNITVGTEVSILHTSLSQTLSNNYCVSLSLLLPMQTILIHFFQ